MTIHLHGVGHFHPDTRIDNKFLEALDIGTNEPWILERVGIRERRSVLPADYIVSTKNAEPLAAIEAVMYTQAEMGARAGQMALERAGLTAGDIGMVIGGGSMPDTGSPAEACHIAARLGIEATAFDTNSACTSIFVPLYLLSMMDGKRLPRFILIVVTESLTRTVDYRDRATAVLWGDCAAAYVVSLTEPGRAEIDDVSLGSSPAGHDKVVVPRMGFFRQDGQAVQKFAIKYTLKDLRRLQESHTIEGRKLGFIGHQANLRMLEKVCAMGNVPADHHFSNVEHFGNTAAAGSPSVISQNWDRWHATDDLAVVGVGSGLTWGAYLMRFKR
jgi:3-oxoacyl-[acyl-carrier-protein] synthase-3